MAWMEKKAELYGQTGNAWEVSEQQAKNLEKAFKAMRDAGRTGAASSITSAFTSMGPASVAFAALALVMKAIEPIVKIISTLFDIFSASLMKGLMPAIKPLIPILIKFAPLIELLGTLFAWFIRIGLLPLALVVYAIGVAIASVVDFITGILSLLTGGLIAHTTWLAEWNKLMLPLLGGLITPGFQTGTSYVQQTGTYTLHQGEAVTTAEERISELRRQDHMERQTAALERLVYLKEDKI